MTIATLQKEIKQLRERQKQLERVLSYFFISHRPENIRLSYLKRLRHISREMRGGRGIKMVNSRQELKQFFRNL